jgi:hypothetical protein
MLSKIMIDTMLLDVLVVSSQIVFTIVFSVRFIENTAEFNIDAL